jgi:tripartite-type tricarboxylate transporter receptor subunit TctC
LGIASDRRLPLLAEVPTLAEQGIPLRFSTWGGLFAPSGTPVEVIRTLNHETVVALNSADVRARMSELGFEVYGNSSEEFSEMVKADFAKMAKVIRQAGIEPQ